MTVLVLVLLGIAWAVVLLWPKSRRLHPARHGGLSDHMVRLNTIASATPDAGVDSSPRPQIPAPPRPARSGPARRRRALLLLVVGAALTLLVALVAGGTVLWSVQFVADLLLVAYLSLLIRHQRRTVSHTVPFAQAIQETEPGVPAPTETLLEPDTVPVTAPARSVTDPVIGHDEPSPAEVPIAELPIAVEPIVVEAPVETADERPGVRPATSPVPGARGRARTRGRRVRVLAVGVAALSVGGIVTSAALLSRGSASDPVRRADAPSRPRKTAARTVPTSAPSPTTTSPPSTTAAAPPTTAPAVPPPTAPTTGFPRVEGRPPITNRLPGGSAPLPAAVPAPTPGPAPTTSAIPRAPWPLDPDFYQQLYEQFAGR